MATVNITKAGVIGSIAQAQVAITAASVQGASPVSVYLTQAGVQAAAPGAFVTIVKGSVSGTTSPVTVTITKASVQGTGRQGNVETIKYLTRVNGVWVETGPAQVRVAGAWVSPFTGSIITPPPPTSQASATFTRARVQGVLATSNPGGGGSTTWNPNIGPMQRLDKGSDDRLPGVPVVWYEDLYITGDTVSAAMARLTTEAIISFPEGRFVTSDFNTNSSPYATIVPKNCRGIWGSGRGSVGSSVGTVFSMVPNSSTKKSQVPLQDNSTAVQMRNMYHGGATSSDIHHAQFRVEGVEQGHIYHNFTVYNPPGKVTIHDVLSHGSYGNNGAPPGETFLIEVHGATNNLTDPLIYDCEADGRRTLGGLDYSAVGIDIANCVRGTVRNCYAHHTNYSSLVVFQSFNVNTFDMRCGDPTDTDGVSVDGRNQGGRINHERAANITHTRPVLHSVFKGVGVTTHFTHSNDVYTQGGFSTANGAMKVIDPKYNDIWNNGAIYCQSWHGYWTGCSMDGVNKTGIPATPYFVDAAGTPFPASKFRYVHTPPGGFTKANGFDPALGQTGWNVGTPPAPPHPNV